MRSFVPALTWMISVFLALTLIPPLSNRFSVGINCVNGRNDCDNETEVTPLHTRCPIERFQRV
jgi:hypothetical protein